MSAIDLAKPVVGFDRAFDRLMGHEGGLSLDPNDRGNWTSGEIGVGDLKGSNWGISAASYPHLDIRNLTREDSKEIYRVDFWQRARADEYDSAIGFQLFDAAVNSGPGNAIRFLQRAVGVADDGKIGAITVAAIRSMSVTDVLARFNAERLEFMTKLSGWPTQGKGWARRIVGNLRYSAQDA